MVIYLIVYLHKVSVLKVLLLLTKLLLAVFTLFLELIDIELDFTTDVLIYGKFTFIRSEL